MSISKNAAKKLRDLYLGQTVIIYLKNTQVPLPVNDSELTVSAMIEMFVLDVDEDYLYGGTPDGIVTKTVQHDLAGLIEIMNYESDYAEFPGDGDEVH